MSRFVLLSALVLVLVPGVMLHATVIHVPADQPTIEDGIDAGNPGDTVLVAPGLYFENVLMAEGINLFGSGWDQTIIDGGGNNNVIAALYGVVNYVIDGFEVRNSDQGGGTPGNVGIFLNPNASTGTKVVRNCYVHNNGQGIVIWNDFGGTAFIENNIVSENIYDGFQPYLGTTYLSNNTITGNGWNGYYDGSGGGFVYIENNIIAQNGRYGILKHRDTPVFISYNDVWSNPLGNYYQWYAGPPTPFVPSPGTGEISEDPLFLDPGTGDFSLLWGSPCIDSGNPSYEVPWGGACVIDMGALEYFQRINCHKEPAPSPFAK